jgi:hypothetical protein
MDGKTEGQSPNSFCFIRSPFTTFTLRSLKSKHALGMFISPNIWIIVSRKNQIVQIIL